MINSAGIEKPPAPVLLSIDGSTYQVAEDFKVKFGYWLRQLQFAIPAGYRTDIASIPWWFRSIMDRASLGLLAPVVHDYLCDSRGRITTLEGEELQIGWFEVNLLFFLLMRLDGVPWQKALWAFLGVTIGCPKW
jgi:hypothetical protein